MSDPKLDPRLPQGMLPLTEGVPRARLIANYLPQFHPIPENDNWWGPGFTEWRNVARARPLFPGHDQPRHPGELGYYDLRVPEVRIAQAALARAHGIEGFCYWHYWSAGKRLLERPFEEMVASGAPDFPFCVGWANQSWKGIWHGAPGRVLMQQEYPGEEDDARHFETLLPAFCDSRYLRARGLPLLLVLRPAELPTPRAWTDRWRKLAEQAGLPGLYLVAYAKEGWPAESHGFDATTWSRHQMPRMLGLKRLGGRFPLSRRGRDVWDFGEVLSCLHDSARAEPAEVGAVEHHPTILAGWDNSPRVGKDALILNSVTPEVFRRHVRNVLAGVVHKNPEDRIVFVKSWNEWAEGNYLEPDLRFGRGLLEALRDEVMGPDRTRSEFNDCSSE